MPEPSAFDFDAFELAARIVESYPDQIPFDDFAHYRLLRPIGKGGMGEIFLAEDQTAGRFVAIKFLRELRADADLRERFAREIKYHAQLEHPYIARVYDAGLHPSGTPYFVMEYVEGKPLNQCCREERLSLDGRIRLFRHVCEAVQYAHSRAFIHLDLKPANILVTQDGTPKLLDFGIAKHLESFNQPVNQTQPLCTPAFAAPEQIRRGLVGTYTDVYALGVILYELLAGKPAYDLDGCTPGQAEAIITACEPAKPSLAASRIDAARSSWNDLDVLCLKAIKKDPQERYDSVLELAQDIDRFLLLQPLNASPDTPAYRAAKFLRRNRRAVLVSAAICAAFVGLTVFYTARLAKARDAALLEELHTRRVQRFMVSMFGADHNAGPPDTLRVKDVLESAVEQAGKLNQDPAMQTQLYETLGGIYQSLGEYDRAQSLLQQAVERSRSAFGLDSPAFAGSLVALTFLRIDQARFQDAEKLARQAVAIDKRRLPADDQKLGLAMTALGSTLEHRGAYPEAIQVLNESVRIHSLPAGDPADLADSLVYLANTQHFLGHDAIAESLQRRVLATERTIYGNRHPAIAEDLMNLGQIQEQIGLYADAERNERQARQIEQSWYGADGLETAVAAEGLAGTLIYERKYDQALPLLKHALKVEEHDVGKDTPRVALIANLLGVIALKRAKLDEAATEFRKMDAIYRSVFGDKDKHVALGLLRFGELYEATADYPRAEESFRQSARLFAETLAADNVQTGIARIELGGLLLREHRYKQAETELLAGYRIVTPGRAVELQAASDARAALISLYQTLNEPEKTARLRSEQLRAERSGLLDSATK